MKAYVIKNENDYYYTLDEDQWDDEIYRAFITKDKEIAEEISNEYNKHKKEDEVSCQVVEITIYEGDPLELACEELRCRDKNKTQAKLVIQQIKNEWLGENVAYKDWFIQQAKESERDERD